MEDKLKEIKGYIKSMSLEELDIIIALCKKIKEE